MFPIPAEKLGDADHLTVFVYHDAIDQGVVGLDDFVIRPQKPDESVETVNPTPSPSSNEEGRATANGPAGDEGEAAGDEVDVSNGGFENGVDGWMYEQWDGKPVPGEVVQGEAASEGGAYFQLGLPGAEGKRYLAKEIIIPDPSQDWRISYQLKTDSVPDGAARVRLQIPGQGWLHTAEQYPDQLETGGTADWATHTIDLPGSQLGGKRKVTLYFYHDQMSRGTVGVDGVRLQSADERAASPRGEGSSAPTRGSLETLTFELDEPSVLRPVEDGLLAVHVEPEEIIYAPDRLPRVVIEHAGSDAAAVTWQIRDGFDEVIDASAEPIAEQNVAVQLPVGHGYYAIVAQLREGDDVIAEVRRSIGALSEAPAPEGNEPFGLWIQGRDDYPRLGVRWTRQGLYYTDFASDPEGAVRYWRRQFDAFREQGIKVLAYPKGQPTDYQISRELMVDTPEAWAALEGHWANLVKGLAGHVDAWGVINEPMSTFWEGDNEMVMKYWTLFREIVDEHDPDTPVIGPSLNPLTARHVNQYQDLLDRGFGELIDGIEVHPYTSSPEDNGMIDATQRFQKMTQEAIGRELPVWVTEMGVSATYPQELSQARFLVRSWLLAKEAGYPMMIWHMFSWPQGEDQREVDFGIFRNTKEPGGVPQPRPAGVAYGAIARELSGARFAGKLEHLGPSVHAYVFERDGEALLALWTTSKRDYPVQLAVDQPSIQKADMFGRQTSVAANNGLIDVTVTQSPVFLRAMPAYYLDTQPPAKLAGPMTVLPGRGAEQTLAVANPTREKAELHVEWLDRPGWQIASAATQWQLDAGEQAETPLEIIAPTDASPGMQQVFGKVYLDGRYIFALRVPVDVQPPVKVAELTPAYRDGQPVIAVQLERMAEAIEQTEVRSAEDSSTKRVRFGEQDRVVVFLPIDPADQQQLHLVEVVASAEGVQTSGEALLSFTPAYHMEQPPRVDGSLDDWAQLDVVTLDEGAVNITWGWDNEHLYLAVRVRDAVHQQTRPAHMTWEQDSLQIGIAPGAIDQLIRPFEVGLQEAEMMEFDLALGTAGPTLYRHRTVNKLLAPAGDVGQEALGYAVTHTNGQTHYEAAFPVEQLGFKSLTEGAVLRAALLVNDADDGERTMRAWFGGIARSKDPAAFGHLILLSPGE